MFRPVWSQANFMMSHQPDLNPCPFCDEDESKPDIWRKRARTAGGYHYYVKCRSCDCLGPRGLSHDQAAEYWNKRAAA